jgi:site-specific DNA-methyltransferase (adenine-specific)
MRNNPLPRLDTSPELRDRLLPYCRLKPGEIWQDPASRHRVGCLDATNAPAVATLVAGSSPTLAIQDPPYNLAVFDLRSIDEYIKWSRRWVRITAKILAEDSSLYIWIGADQNDGFQPLADFIIMMRDEPFATRSFITMRNQRGYGTQKNWMAVRQELLYYTKGNSLFNVEAESLVYKLDPARA